MSEIWIDGFNLLHRWERTRDLLPGPGRVADIGAVVSEGLAQLSEALGPARRQTVVFLDGGLVRQSTTASGLRVRYAGPGAKADALLLEAAEGRGERARLVTVVTDDRALAAALRSRGTRIESVGSFADERLRHRTQAPRERDSYKTRSLTDLEIDAWKRVFDDGTGRGEGDDGTA